MNICFFTMANNKRLDWAYNLILSGAAVNRPIWFYRIPETHPDPKRFKTELLVGDLLPEADKYIYLDSDIFMLQHGDWESEEAIGAVSEAQFHIGAKHYFAKGDSNGYNNYITLLKQHNNPTRVNTGLIAIPSNIRKQVGERWQYWCEYIESFCNKPMKMRDQPQFPFVTEELKIPVLPGRFCAIVKRENVLPEHIALHASGHPSGNSLKQYTDAVDRVLGGNKGINSESSMRWHILSRLILSYSENPIYPIGAEVGVFKGENAINLLNTFPGLKLHCVDNRQPMGAEKKYPDAENIWNNISSKYGNRIINHTCNSTEVKIDELLDYAFIDADHRTEAVIKDIEYYLPFIKSGGFIAGHDINRKGTYYNNTSVREGVEKVFGNNFHTSSDHTWYHIKK